VKRTVLSKGPAASRMVTSHPQDFRALRDNAADFNQPTSALKYPKVVFWHSET
jgi:hypothetical protein